MYLNDPRHKKQSSSNWLVRLRFFVPSPYPQLLRMNIGSTVTSLCHRHLKLNQICAIILPLKPAPSTVSSLGKYHCHTQLLNPKTGSHSWVVSFPCHCTADRALTLAVIPLTYFRSRRFSLSHCYRLHIGRRFLFCGSLPLVLTGLTTLPPAPSHLFPILSSKLP